MRREPSERVGRTTPTTIPVTDAPSLLEQICGADGACEGRNAVELNPFFPAPADEEEPAEGVPAEPAQVITIEDLARFLPAEIELHAEPDGWAVVGVPANFWTEVRPVVVGGTLLGEAADVRFTPRLYEWRYGDGERRVTEGAGSSWEDAGQEELTETPTGHVYRERSDARASVLVYWSAEYRFAGSGWITVAGAVSNSSAPTRVLVVRERTVLTAD